MSRTMASTASCLAGVWLAACGGGESVGGAEAEIVGGRPAPGQVFSSVGALVAVKGRTVDPYCTGALITPRLVLTAKHCDLLKPTNAPSAFAIGPDATRPERLIPILGFTRERTHGGGLLGLGSDVAIAHLAEAVDLEPIQVREARSREVGLEFRAVGYGSQSQTDANAPSGTRRLARLRLAGVGPSPYWPLVYEQDFEAFLADIWSNEPEITQELRDLGQFFWEADVLEPHYDALFRRVNGNTAGGDSGGPIFTAGEVTGDLVSVGVVSGVVSMSTESPDPVLENFTIYSTIGPEVRHLIRSAKVCGLVPEEGLCDGEVRRRCSSATTAQRTGRVQIESRNCGAEGLTCALTPAGARCQPSCRSNSECTGGSACIGGTCSFRPEQLCAGEPGGFACSLCCVGALGDFSDEAFLQCNDVCFPEPAGTVQAAPLRAQVHFPGFPGLAPQPLR